MLTVRHKKNIGKVGFIMGFENAKTRISSILQVQTDSILLRLQEACNSPLRTEEHFKIVNTLPLNLIFGRLEVMSRAMHQLHQLNKIQI